MTTKKLEVYKCNVCGNMVSVTRAAGGTLTCCGQAMELLSENTTDAATEKHVPVVEVVDTGIKVTVGSVPHPMEEKHLIEWIEVIDAGGNSYRQFLKPGDAPEAVFPIGPDGITVREFCNLHGLWKS